MKISENNKTSIDYLKGNIKKKFVSFLSFGFLRSNNEERKFIYDNLDQKLTSIKNGKKHINLKKGWMKMLKTFGKEVMLLSKLKSLQNNIEIQIV